MKNNLLLFSAVLAALSLASCNKTEEDELLDGGIRYEFNQPSLSFGAEGGNSVVFCLNSDLWFVHSIQVTGTDIYYYGSKREDSSVTGDGIKAITFDNNKLSVTVDPSSTKREWTVGMSCIDNFGYLTIYQNPE